MAIFLSLLCGRQGLDLPLFCLAACLGFQLLCLVHWTEPGQGNRVSNTTSLHRKRGSLDLKLDSVGGGKIASIHASNHENDLLWPRILEMCILFCT